MREKDEESMRIGKDYQQQKVKQGIFRSKEIRREKQSGSSYSQSSTLQDPMKLPKNGRDFFLINYLIYPTEKIDSIVFLCFKHFTSILTMQFQMIEVKETIKFCIQIYFLSFSAMMIHERIYL